MKAIFYRVRSRRAEVLYHAWKSGLAKFGINLPLKWEHERRGIEADVSIHYGLWGSLRDLHKEASGAGAKSVLVDLGYFGRLDGGKVAGFHRISVNALHATQYFQRVRHPPDRFRRFGIETEPFRKSGEHVLLAGMSAKAAWVYGLAPEEWERETASYLLTHTRRPLWYRPKPSWKEATPIPGTLWCGNRDATREPIERDMANAWALVTHHSHAAIEALVQGVPVFCEDGLAVPLRGRSCWAIDDPRYPDEGERDQLLYDAAYTQYKVDEIAEGKAWRYLKEEGLV